MFLFLKVFKICAIAAVILLEIAPSAIAERPKAPDTGTPSGDTTPGTTRPEAACPTTLKPLTAIFANQGRDFTLAAYPTFYFYVPYTPQQISSIEFLIFNETATKTIYHSAIELKDRPGIIRVQLPPDIKNSLAVDRTYQWRFNLDCQPDETIVPDLVLNGWIERVADDPEIADRLKSAEFEYEVYRERDLWYDTIANLSNLHFANPKNERLRKAWNSTLRQLNLDWIVTESLVDSELKPLSLE